MTLDRDFSESAAAIWADPLSMHRLEADAAAHKLTAAQLDEIVRQATPVFWETHGYRSSLQDTFNDDDRRRQYIIERVLEAIEQLLARAPFSAVAPFNATQADWDNPLSIPRLKSDIHARRSTREQRSELLRLAAPIYKASRQAHPYYMPKMNDDSFWHKLIMSRPGEAIARVALASEPALSESARRGKHWLKRNAGRG